MKVKRAYTYTATKVSLKEETRKSLLLSSPREREKEEEEEKSQEKFVFVCLFVSSRVPPPPLDGKLCSFSPRLFSGWGHERREEGAHPKKRGGGALFDLGRLQRSQPGEDDTGAPE